MNKTDYALIGYPLGHSVSPFIHAELFRLAGIDGGCNYSLCEIMPEKLEGSYEFLRNLKGFNITIPLKTEIIPFCSETDITAEQCGAVNCVAGGIGYNTDVYGFTKSAELMGINLSSPDLKICVLGYGGAGRMFAAEALRQGASLTVAVRNGSALEKIEIEAEKTLTEKLKGSFDLIINATPSGMYPNIGECPVSFDKIGARYALDAVFNPLKTKFMSEAEKKGIKTLNGVPMLVWQAVRSHEIWNGSVYKDKDIENLIIKTTELLSKR